MSNVTYKMFVDKMGGTRAEDYIGVLGDCFYDPYSTLLRVSDGMTPGGIPYQGQANVVVLSGGTF